MTLPRLGHAVIVNNIATEMPGSLRDVEALVAAYKTIGFDVKIHNDCSAQVIFRTIVLLESKLQAWGLTQR